MKKERFEIDEGTGYIGFNEAVDIVKSNIKPAGEESLPLDRCCGRVASEDLQARTGNPDADVALKDGYALISADVENAAPGNPVTLRVSGSAFAGVPFRGTVSAGYAVRICSGATIPEGADAVVASEFCTSGTPGEVRVMADAGEGRNVMRAGVEVAAGELVACRGTVLGPGVLGLAAAAGISMVEVIRRPHVAVVSIGDEVVAPGAELKTGQLYASNMITIGSWLEVSGIPHVCSVVPDEEERIADEMEGCLSGADCIITSGGAWGSERDLVVGTLDRLEWRKLFHYVRMGPGKGVAFGLLGGVPVFCLPGGPTSNMAAFLHLALPAVLRMAGEKRHPLATVKATLLEEFRGRHVAWTEFRDAVITREADGTYAASLYRNRSRLRSIAYADGYVCIPEKRETLPAGEVVDVQMLTWPGSL